MEERVSECVICFDNLPENSRFELSCGHSDICLKCTKQLSSCPLCRDLLFVTVIFKTTDGLKHYMQWGLNESTEDIAKRFKKLTNTQDCQLLYSGRVLLSDTTPNMANITNNSIIHVILNLKGD